ncbi:MAG TPA: pitrilysin family protein [Patescibacteria group bacterium]|nr:pitrilysin family protein [Patescibacteria group bacterium]
MKIPGILRLQNLAVAIAAFAVFYVPAKAQFKPITFSEYTLPNGLHVILHRDESAPVVSTVVHYRVGARDEDPTRSGFAHFFEHLMFEGTSNIERAAMSGYVQEAGGTLNAYTSFDETVYQFTLPSNELKLALWIESQRMRSLLVDEIGVQTQRGVVKEERKNRYDNAPYGTWMESIFKNLFGTGTYSWTPIGSAQHIDSAKIDEFRSFYNQFYQPNNATLVIAGDFNMTEAREWVDQYFGGFKNAGDIKRNQMNVTQIQNEVRQTVEDPKAQLPAVFIGFTGPKKGSSDIYAMEMLTDILSNGESSRMYRRLVDQDQIAVAAQSFAFDLQYGGALIALGVAAPGKDISIVEKTIYDEINRIVREGVTDKEFEKARNIIEAKFVQGKKGTLEKAIALAQYHTYFGSASVINNEIDRYMKVTKADLQRVAQQYLNSDKRVVLTYLPKGQ